MNHRHHGDRHGCALGGRCEPAYAEVVDLSTCTRGFVRTYRPGDADRPKAKAVQAKEMPCIYFGDPIRRDDGLRETVPCPPCAAKAEETVNVPVHECKIHKRCTPRGNSDSVKSCGNCADRITQADSHKLPATQEHYRNLMRQFIAVIPEYPHGKFDGRGVVIVGGGKYFASTYVTIRVLRHVGCNLPVQVWSLPGEVDEKQRTILESLPGVECVTASTCPEFRTVGGWQLKSYAVLSCPWREVLYLDADSYPAQNPERLFEWGRYQEDGSIFFPDIASWKLHDDAWPLFGLKPLNDIPWESGQFIVDKESCWREMQLAHWFNQNSAYYYAHGNIGLHGDKDLFHFAWRVLDRTFYHPRTSPAGWDLHTILQYGPDGKVAFNHRVRDKFVLGDEAFSTTPQTFRGEGRNRRNPRLAHEDFCFAALDDLRRLVEPTFLAALLTCPGREVHLAATLASLRETDWNADPLVVRDESTLDDKRARQVETSRRLLAEAMERPWDYLLFLEDDVVFNKNVRRNLLRWKRLKAINLASLYRPNDLKLQGDVAEASAVYGSQAFVISRKTVQFILDHYDEQDGMQDIRFSRLAAKLGPIYYHVPSLVQHVGKISAWTGDDSRFHEAVNFDQEFKS